MSGFTTVVVPEVELLVGQNHSLPLMMQVAALPETLTVNGGIRWDADGGALDPPHITTKGSFNPAGGAP